MKEQQSLFDTLVTTVAICLTVLLFKSLIANLRSVGGCLISVLLVIGLGALGVLAMPGFMNFLINL